ncbi:MAG TPA: type II toxin-antitoxin system VapC family toxin [Pyrinomonadaceae bacterium]|nr:type II toxin-antitoxin system VapC family toxin [Pyrinomonadaceae bacterium]
MAIYFFDTSALVKRYALEDGRLWVQSITGPTAANRIYMARITGAEVIAAVKVKERERHITAADAAKVIADFRYDFTNQYQIIEITDTVVTKAMLLIETHVLKGYDGVQLAAAVEIHNLLTAIGMPALGAAGLTLVAADKQLNSAALAEGLTVENPENHLDTKDKIP